MVSRHEEISGFDSQYRAIGAPALKAFRDAAKAYLGRVIQGDEDMVAFAVWFAAQLKVEDVVSEEIKALDEHRTNWHTSYMTMYRACVAEGSTIRPSHIPYPASGERSDYVTLHMLIWEACKLHNKYNPRKQYGE